MSLWGISIFGYPVLAEDWEDAVEFEKFWCNYQTKLATDPAQAEALFTGFKVIRPDLGSSQEEGAD